MNKKIHSIIEKLTESYRDNIIAIIGNYGVIDGGITINEIVDDFEIKETTIVEIRNNLVTFDNGKTDSLYIFSMNELYEIATNLYPYENFTNM